MSTASHDTVQTFHATSIVMEERAILLRGDPGVGKSDLALRLLDHGVRTTRLIADDRTVLETRGGVVWASVPPSIAGLMEVRGLGLVSVPEVVPIGQAFPVSLVVDLMATPDQVERLPDIANCQILGVPVPWLAVYGFAASAPQVVCAALDVVLGRRSITR